MNVDPNAFVMTHPKYLFLMTRLGHWIVGPFKDQAEYREFMGAMPEDAILAATTTAMTPAEFRDRLSNLPCFKFPEIPSE